LAALTVLVIQNNDNNKIFSFRGVEFTPRKRQNTISIPIVNASAANNVLFRFFGQEESVTFSFALFNDGVDVSNGTEAGGITTIAEQIQYLKDTIFTENFDVDWDLWDTLDLVYPDTAPISGVIEDLALPIREGSVQVVVGNMAFKRGRIGAL